MNPLDAALLLVLRNGLVLALVLSLPVLVVALVVALLTSFFQSATQLGDPALGTVPRQLAVIGLLAAAGAPLAAPLLRFTRAVLESLAR